MGLSGILGEENAILLHEVEYALYFVLPLSVFVSILLAPRGFFGKPWRVLLYIVLGPIGTADLARRAIRARATSAHGTEARPATIRRGGIAILVGFAALLGTGLVLAMETRWPSWYFPLVRAHRAIGLAFMVAYLAYLMLHVRRYAGARNVAMHFAFSLSLLLVLLFVNVDSKLPTWALVTATATIFASAVWLRRLDRRTEEGRSRGGLLLNTYLLVALASGLYLVPSVNEAIANNFGNYYYHLHGIVSMFGVPLAFFLFLHHVRRTPTSFPWPARLAVVAVGVPFAIHAITVADRKTHATEIGGYHHQGQIAAPTVVDRAAYSAPHEWWVEEMNEVASCERCHGVLFEQWQGSAHALSGRNLFYREVLDGLVDAGRLDDTAYCQSCHQPTLAALPDRILATSAELMATDEGVSCKACHLAFALDDPPRNGAVVYREEERAQGILRPGDPYRPPPDEHMRDDLRLHLKSFNSELFGSREFCATCHRIEIPGHPARAQSLVLPNPYDLAIAEPEVPGCKSCHMPEDSKNRKGVKFPNHHMFGINASWEAMLPMDTPGEVRAAVRTGDQATLDWLTGRGAPKEEIGYGRAFDEPVFRLGVDWYAPTGTARLSIEVLNQRGGHPFPLGSLDLAEGWLRLEVRSGDELLLRSGYAEEDGSLQPDTRRYGARLTGPDGGPLEHHDLLAATGVEDLNLLHPGIPQVEDFRFEVPAQAYPLTVSTELRYRRAHGPFLRSALGERSEDLEDVVLAALHCTIASPTGACEPR